MRLLFSIQSPHAGDMQLSEHFGESCNFVVYDVQRNCFETLACEPALCRGPCHCHLPLFGAHAFDAVICRNIGARAFSMLRRHAIDVLLTSEHYAEAALRAWRLQRLSPVSRGVCRPEYVARRTLRRGPQDV